MSYLSRTQARYASYESGIGSTVTKGEATFESLEAHAFAHGDVIPASGRREMLENLINDFLELAETLRVSP